MRFIRGVLTSLLPLLLVLVTAVWAVLAGTVPPEWAYPALLVAGSLSGDPAVRAVFRWADASSQRTEPTPSPWADPEVSEQPQDPALRGGLVIGILERAAAMLSLLSAHSSGIAVVVAIKGLARYGEFTNPRQREEFIIGTLASLVWAALFAAAALWVTAGPGPFRGT